MLKHQSSHQKQKRVKCMKLNPDKKYLVSCSMNEIFIWNLLEKIFVYKTLYEQHEREI